MKTNVLKFPVLHFLGTKAEVKRPYQIAIGVVPTSSNVDFDTQIYTLPDFWSKTDFSSQDDLFTLTRFAKDASKAEYGYLIFDDVYEDFESRFLPELSVGQLVAGNIAIAYSVVHAKCSGGSLSVLCKPGQEKLCETRYLTDTPHSHNVDLKTFIGLTAQQTEGRAVSPNVCWPFLYVNEDGHSTLEFIFVSWHEQNEEGYEEIKLSDGESLLSVLPYDGLLDIVRCLTACRAHQKAWERAYKSIPQSYFSMKHLEKQPI